MYELLRAASSNMPLAEREVVFVDEIDKCARRSKIVSITSDVSGTGVLAALLNILQGNEIGVAERGSARKNRGGYVSFMLSVNTYV